MQKKWKENKENSKRNKNMQMQMKEIDCKERNKKI